MSTWNSGSRIAWLAALTLAVGCGKPKEAASPAVVSVAPASPAAAESVATPAPAPVDTHAPAPAPKPATPPPPKPKPKPSAPPATPADQPTPQQAASDPEHDIYHPAPRDTVSEDTYQGWKQFELNCSRCHGEYGVGTSFAPALIASLKDDGTIPTKEAFITTVCAGRPEKGMPSWCAAGLEMDKIERIYSYLKGRADGKIGIGRPAVRE